MSSSAHFNYNGDVTLAPIVIILQKKDQPDDKLVIRATENSTNFTATFTQNTIGVRTERHLAHSELFPYIERFLESLQYDLQRCDFVQIDVPGYTSVMLKSTETHYYLDTFYAQVRSLHNSWPTEVEGKRILRTVAPTWTSTWVPAVAQTQQTQQTQTEETARPKRSASPRVTRAAARRAAY